MSETGSGGNGSGSCACGLGPILPSSHLPSVGDTGEGAPGWPVCGCGLGAILRDAWTQKNAGRRFYGCQNYGNPRFCGFHLWYDPPTPDHLKETILGVRCDGRYAWKKVAEVEAEVERLKKVSADFEAKVQRLKNEVQRLKNVADDYEGSLSVLEMVAEDAFSEVTVMKDEGAELRKQVKKLQQQRICFALAGFVVLAMYWLDL